MQLSDEEVARLRQSGIRLDAEGRFFHEGGEVLHAGMRAAFFRWLDREPDGRYVLRLDARRFVYLDVDDAPFVVRSLRWEADGAHLRLSDDSDERLALETVRIAPTGIAYCTVKAGRFDARFASAAWSSLAEHIVEREGVAWLEAAGTSVRLGPVDSAAAPPPPARR